MALTLTDVRGMGNTLKQNNYDLVIPNPPAGGDGDILRLAVASSAIPGFSSEIVERAHHGHVIKEAGRGMFPRTLPAEFFETSELTALTLLKAWHTLQWNNETGEQSDTNAYKTDGYIILLDAARKESKKVRFKGLFIEDVADSPLDGASSEIVRVSVTFSYDDWDFE